MKKNKIETYNNGLVRILKQDDKVALGGKKVSINKTVKENYLKNKTKQNKLKYKRPTKNPKQTPAIVIMTINLLHLQCISILVYKNPNFD